MSITITPTTTAPAAPTLEPAATTESLDAPTLERVVHPELVALAASLAAAADARSAALGELASPALRRRATKLAVQLRAASRLVANGAHLTPPATLSMLARRAESAGVSPAPSTGDIAQIDAAINSWRGVIVALHGWRGHVDSVPSDEE